MPINRILSTLTGVARFASGVGDLDDLRVRVREDPDGGWFSVIHKGYYYIGTEQGYLFANRGRLSFTETTTGQINIRTINISGLVDDPTEKGPVIFSKVGNPRPLQRVSSPLRAFRPVTVSGTGEVKSFSVPSSGILVSVVSDPITGILLAVPATGDIISNQDYVYDRELGVVFMRGNLPPNLYVTYLVGEEQDMLRQEEVVVVDTDNKVRTQFKPVSLYTNLGPIIRKPTSAGTVYASGIAVTGNVVTFASTGQISSGDIVAVEYYVKDSYSAVPSGSNLVIRYLLSTSGSYNVDYETGDVYYDTSLLSSGSTDYIQLNPLLEHRESGFLYLKDETEPTPAAGSLKITLSNHNQSWTPATSEDLDITITVYDAEGEPLPGKRVITTASGASGTLVVAFPANQVTNGRGHVVYAWGPDASGQVIITTTVSGSSISGQLSFFVRDRRFFTQESEQRLGKLLLHMEDQPVRDNIHKLSAYYCYADGAPYQPHGRNESWFTRITFKASKSKFYSLDGTPLPQTATVNTNIDSIASILVDPIPGDVIRAEVETEVTGRIRIAAPLRIPDVLKEV